LGIKKVWCNHPQAETHINFAYGVFQRVSTEELIIVDIGLIEFIFTVFFHGNNALRDISNEISGENGGREVTLPLKQREETKSVVSEKILSYRAQLDPSLGYKNGRK
jgi:hypothetical protein